ncbi:hypothetical protein OIU84_024605 [Salix udensis]|uniref:Uncharacterized protein n=1 Tax=Salix udensis TaxID=889485 RepID=A0AAD6KI51_9ROSI|nr:hypothetical protein OIU84_024605 [Salix udensis]
MLTASGNTINRDAHLADRYDGAMFYGMPQYHSVHPHPQYHGPNLDLSVATAPNFYVPYMAPSSVTSWIMLEVHTREKMLKETQGISTI